MTSSYKINDRCLFTSFHKKRILCMIFPDLFDSAGLNDYVFHFVHRFLHEKECSMFLRTKKRTWSAALSGAFAFVMVVCLLGSIPARAEAGSLPAAFTRYDISASGGFAIGITVDDQGNPWFGLGNGSIGMIHHTTGQLQVYPLANANAGVGTIKLDNAGNVWFTEGNIPGIGELNQTTRKEHTFLLPPASRQAGLTPTFLVLDQSGNVWFNEVDYSDATGGKLARLSSNGTITEWAVPTVGAEIEEIALDHQGNLWFAEQGNISLHPSPNKVGRLNPQQRTITEYPSPTPNSRPAGIVVAPDDTIWFSEHATDTIAHLFPDQAVGVTTSVTPVSTEASHAVSSQAHAPGAPTHPMTTPEQEATVQPHVTHAPGIVEYHLPATGSLANTEDMRFDKEGNLFFEDDATGHIGELLAGTGQGNGKDAPTIHEWSIPQGVGFYNIEFDPQGTTLWISDTAGFGPGGSVYRFPVS
jgi:streptogramin lyase